VVTVVGKEKVPRLFDSVAEVMGRYDGASDAVADSDIPEAFADPPDIADAVADTADTTDAPDAATADATDAPDADIADATDDPDADIADADERTKLPRLLDTLAGVL